MGAESCGKEGSVSRRPAAERGMGYNIVYGIVRGFGMGMDLGPSGQAWSAPRESQVQFSGAFCIEYSIPLSCYANIHFYLGDLKRSPASVKSSGVFFPLRSDACVDKNNVICSSSSDIILCSRNNNAFIASRELCSNIDGSHELMSAAIRKIEGKKQAF